VHFAFTDDQLAFRDAVRDLLAKECPPSVVRRAWDEPGRAGGAWSALGDMGVLAVLASEARGGLGLGWLDLVLLLEESGFAALPEPLVEHAAVAVPLLDDPGGALDGSTTITAPFHHDTVMPYADRSDAFLVFEDATIRLASRERVEVEPCESVDGARRLGRVTPIGEAPVVAEGDDPGRAFDRGALGTAAQLVGLARRMIEMTVEYATERRQFGVPIGSFQAVKHHLADARLALEFARPLVYRAAWSIDADDPHASSHVSMAKATASDAAALAGRQALQCHGAIGYSFEHDLHLFLKRAWVLAAAWGDADRHRDRVGRAILGP
jgi:alkylation response protein AidB-like acyl-CoA dehydrogenase